MHPYQILVFLEPAINRYFLTFTSSIKKELSIHYECLTKEFLEAPQQKQNGFSGRLSAKKLLQLHQSNM